MQMKVTGKKSNGNTLDGNGLVLSGDDCLLIESELVNGNWEVSKK
jgi:hypothetical protein